MWQRKQIRGYSEEEERVNFSTLTEFDYLPFLSKVNIRTMMSILLRQELILGIRSGESVFC